MKKSLIIIIVNLVFLFPLVILAQSPFDPPAMRPTKDLWPIGTRILTRCKPKEPVTEQCGLHEYSIEEWSAAGHVKLWSQRGGTEWFMPHEVNVIEILPVPDASVVGPE